MNIVLEDFARSWFPPQNLTQFYNFFSNKKREHKTSIFTNTKDIGPTDWELTQTLTASLPPSPLATLNLTDISTPPPPSVNLRLSETGLSTTPRPQTYLEDCCIPQVVREKGGGECTICIGDQGED